METLEGKGNFGEFGDSLPNLLKFYLPIAHSTMK